MTDEYQKHSLKEVINHTVESSVSFTTSITFLSACFLLEQAKSTSISNIKYLCCHLSHLFFKDSIIEAATAIGHLTFLNILGEFSVNIFDKEKKTNSIGQQESYNQMAEGSNKIIPIMATEYLMPNTGIRTYNEIFSSYTRSIAYDIYSDFNPNSTYSRPGHFANEYELHTEIESPIILGLALASQCLDTSLNNLLLDEFSIEFFKGHAFGIIGKFCPYCSETVGETRDSLIGYFYPEILD